MEWTLKPEGHIACELAATASRVKAEEASPERQVSDQETTGIKQAMSYRENETRAGMTVG